MNSAIDLRSDTVTRPTRAMRAAMSSAELGDDVYGEDPTVNRLQELAAELTGKQGALFMPSGTMANQVAVRAWTQPGDALMTARDAHVYLYEGGGAAALSGVQAVLLGSNGLFGLKDVQAATAPDDIHFARTRLVSIENTHNRSGGRIFPQAETEAIGEWARKRGWALHLDGARVFNASVASGSSVEEIARPFDSVSFCLSKGLGAPVGSLLCGDRGFIKDAVRIRKLFGGGMRQVGMLAAAGIHALDHHVARLAEDHQKARFLAEGLAGVPGIEMHGIPETNIVVIKAKNAPELSKRAQEEGVLLSLMDAATLRAVTHLDVSHEEVASAAEILVRVLAHGDA